MADLDARLIAKASATAGETPSAGDLEVAELAVNTADGKLFTKHTDDSIKEISGSGGGDATAINDLTDVETLATLGTLTYNVDDTQVAGQAATGTQNASTAGGSVYWDISPTDASSVDQSAFWDARVADAGNGIFPVMRYADGGQNYNFIPTSIISQNSIYRVFAPSANSPVLPPNTRDSTITFISQPVNGQVLTWVGANNQWEPADAVGGGGAVNSVNGETGIVSLGIQEMDDFQLFDSPNGSFDGNTDKKDSSFTEAAGEWALGNPGAGAYFAWNLDQDSVMNLLVIGTEVTFVANGVGAHVSTVSSSSQANGDATRFFRIADNWPSEWLSLAVGSSCSVQASVIPGTSPIPLFEGDILQWVAADQKFKPAQLPASGGGGAVDSVNGETGVVSLGIQEMDDYQLNQEVPNSPITRFINLGFNDEPSSQDEGGYSYTSAWGANKYWLSTYDADGIITKSRISLGHSGTIWASYDGVLWGELTLESAITQAYGNDFLDVNIVDGETLFDGPAMQPDGSEIFFSETDPRPLFQDIPLADGNVLEWDDAGQAFKPSQGVNNVFDLADVEKAQGAAPGYTFTVTDEIPENSDGEYYQRSVFGNGSIYLSKIDSNGASISDDFPVGYSGYAYVSINGATARMIEITDVEDIAGGGDGWDFNVVDLVPGAYTVGDVITVTQTPPGPPADLDTTEGQVLAYDATKEAFVPKLTTFSVNGETGAVSLGIQDMDDYSATGTAVEVDLGSWSQGGSYPQQDGEWRNFDSSGYDTWQLYKEDDLGDDYSSELLALVAGDVVQVSTDGGSTYGIAVTLTADAVFSTGGGGDTVISIELSDTDGAKLNGLSGLTLRITQPGPGVPLVGGDVLQWTNAEQKFKPVSLGIQDMDDFELQSSSLPTFSDMERSGTWSNWMDAHSNPPGYEYPTQQGEWRAFNNSLSAAEGTIQLATLDDDGNSCEDWVNVDLTNLKILFTVDGQTYGPIPVTEITDIASYGVVMKWDINDLDPSQYDWGYEIDNPEQAPTSPRPIKPIFVQLGYTYVAQPDIPLAEGDILQWNDAGQKFKPAQLPAVVDSIQEMNDFELNPSGTELSWTFSANTSSVPGTGNFTQWSQNTNFALSYTTSTGENVKAKLDAITPPFDVVLYREGVVLYTGQIVEFGDQNATRVTLKFANANWYPSLSHGDLIVFSANEFADGSVPLAEDDILQWNDLDQKFKPAQLPALVNSVNGETGAVSLGIQEMDDFELLTVSGSYTWPNRANNGNTSADRSCPNSGDWAAYRSNGKTFIYLYDDATSQQLLVGESVTLTIDTGDSYTGTIISNTTSVSNVWAIGFTDDSAQDPILNASLATSLTIASTTLASTPISLAEGDILQWDNAEQKFKPTKDYISLTELKTEVAASADFSDFKSRIAAL